MITSLKIPPKRGCPTAQNPFTLDEVVKGGSGEIIVILISYFSLFP
jgi:hypothetical protein